MSSMKKLELATKKPKNCVDSFSFKDVEVMVLGFDDSKELSSNYQTLYRVNFQKQDAKASLWFERSVQWKCCRLVSQNYGKQLKMEEKEFVKYFHMNAKYPELKQFLLKGTWMAELGFR